MPPYGFVSFMREKSLVVTMYPKGYYTKEGDEDHVEYTDGRDGRIIKYLANHEPHDFLLCGVPCIDEDEHVIYNVKRLDKHTAPKDATLKVIPSTAVMLATKLKTNLLTEGVLVDWPKFNFMVAGNRLYDRRFVDFVMQEKVKRRLGPEETYQITFMDPDMKFYKLSSETLDHVLILEDRFEIVMKPVE